MKGASGLLWAALETLLPEDKKKSYRAVLSHSEVERYYFSSIMYVLDSEGNIVWNFSGKASIYPSVDFSLGEFTRSFAGMDPSSQTVANVMLDASTYYFDYNLWLINQDLAKLPQKDYFKDYPEDRKNKYIAVFSDVTESQLPTVSWSTYNLVERKKTESVIVEKGPTQKVTTKTTKVKDSVTALVNKEILHKPIKIDREFIRRVQRLLTKLGYKAGPADGLFGKNTVSAIQDYQKKSGLLVTGKITTSLLTHLEESVKESEKNANK